MSTYPPRHEGEAPAPTKTSFIHRVIGVFVSPAETFDDIRERPNWLPPLLLMIGVFVVLTAVVPQELFREMVEAQMATQGQEASAQDMDTAVTIARIFGYAAALVFPVVGSLVTAGVLFLIFVLLAGAEARFYQFFSATLYANMVAMLGAIVTTPVAIAQADLHTRLSLALLAPGLEEGFLYGFLNAVTIFGIWTAVVLGIGAARISRTVSTGTAVGLVLGLYLLWSVLFGLFSTFTGAA